jgi:hypothetical protein
VRMMPPLVPLEDLHRDFTRIIETAPSPPNEGLFPDDVMEWAAEADALIQAFNDLSLIPESQVAINGFHFPERLVKFRQLMTILRKARAQAALELRQSRGGPTGPIGNSAVFPHGLNGPAGPHPKSNEVSLSPYYTKDPRTSGMDPLTSNMGFRSQPNERDVPAPITGVQATGGAGQISIPQTTEAKLEELAVKVALLEAAISIPKPPGVGHNRGPNLENEQEDEEEIRRLIALLKDDNAKIVADPIAATDLAQREIQRAEQGLKLHGEFVKGAAKGAGFVVGKELIERIAPSAWWINVYDRLLDVAHALRDLLF